MGCLEPQMGVPRQTNWRRNEQIRAKHFQQLPTKAIIIKKSKKNAFYKQTEDAIEPKQTKIDMGSSWGPTRSTYEYGMEGDRGVSSAPIIKSFPYSLQSLYRK